MTPKSFWNIALVTIVGGCSTFYCTCSSTPETVQARSCLILHLEQLSMNTRRHALSSDHNETYWSISDTWNGSEPWPDTASDLESIKIRLQESRIHGLPRTAPSASMLNRWDWCRLKYQYFQFNWVIYWAASFQFNSSAAGLFLFRKRGKSDWHFWQRGCHNKN